jgi:predicted phosphodiesterase
MLTLLISDAHVEPEQDLTRFEKCAKLIVDRKPDRIIQLGDFVSLSSISGWDMSKKLMMEGRRYQEDVKAGREAANLLFSEIDKLQARQRFHKQKLYSPEIDWLEGNHEDRLDRYLEQHPELEGAFNLGDDLGLTERKIIPFKYRDRIVRNGINYMHAPLAGNNQPLSGLHIPHKALQRFNGHVVMGHYHRSEVANIKRIDTKEVQRAIICPSFIEGQPHYLSKNAPAVIDRGVLLLKQFEGDSDKPVIEEISMGELYGSY